MKRILLIIPLVIAAFALTVSAGDVQSRNITLWNDVVISGTEVPAGQYTVQWTESAPNVQIRFLRAGDEIVSAQATVIKQRNSQESVTTRLEDEGHRILSEISFPNTRLRLAPEDESRTESAD